MTSQIVEYDLRSPGKNYDDLYDILKSFTCYAHITESTWFVKTDLSCKELRDKLEAVLDKNDRIFVAKLTGEAAWCNTICQSQYLKDNL